MDRRVAARILYASLLFLLFLPRAFAQSVSREDGRSAAFAAPFEDETERALGAFRFFGLESYAADVIARAEASQADDRFSLNDAFLSLDLFRSLSDYYRGRPYSSQRTIDSIVTNTSHADRTATDAALLGALEFYGHTPLRRTDVEAGLSRLEHIATFTAAAAAVQPEILFWKAEGFRALGERSRAESNYREAIEKSSDPRLTALTHFRLAELFEREGRFPEADSNFTAVSRIQESPLLLLSLLRLGAVQRSEKNYRAVLVTMNRADSLYRLTDHTIRTSARDLEYASPLIEELMIRSTEEDRILGRVSEAVYSYPRPSQLVSPFYTSEVDLLRGSALSELGQYEQATVILTTGDELIDGARDSSASYSLTEQARFVSDALRFEKGWSLFQRGLYKDAAAAFLELAVADTGRRNYRVLRESSVPLREQGRFFDPFLNDSLAIASTVPTIDRSILSKARIDTTFFIYNDFPERARYYAGVALARAGMLGEAAQTLQKLTLDPAMLYSDQATYQLGLIRFAQNSYEAQKLLLPVSYEKSIRGGYASFLLGELAYRKNDYERAEGYFLNAFANLPTEDTAIRATAHLERGLSLIPLGNWHDAADELNTYLTQSHEHIPGRTDEALFWMGKAYFRAGDYDSAASSLSRLLTEYPTSSRLEDAQYTYAWSLFEANDFARAEPEFERVIAMDSISRYAYDVLVRAGDSYYAMGEYRRANTLYNLGTDRPAFNELRTTRAVLMLGVARLKIDSTRSAMNEFEYFTHKYPQSDIVDLAYFDDAIAAYSINQTASAEATVEKIVSQFRQSAVAPRALFVAGEERVRHGDIRGSLHYYQAVLNSYPRSREAGPALFALQDALADLKRIPEALAIADTFVARNPANPISPMVLIRAGEFKMKLHEPASALASFRSFVAQYPSNSARPQAELLSAEAELATGDTGTAMQALDTIVSKYDSLDVAAAAYLDRARIERVRKAFDSASLDFLRAFQDRYYSFDAAPQAMLEYGEMLTEEKNVDSAVQIFSMLTARYPIAASIAARAAIHAGELLSQQGKNDSARAIYGNVISAHPRDALGGAAEVRIGETYLLESNWAQAAASFTSAKRDFALAPESDMQRLFGLARADVHLGKKAEAIRTLQALLAMRGVPESEHSEADALLHTLQPVLKKKAKKGVRR